MLPINLALFRAVSRSEIAGAKVGFPEKSQKSGDRKCLRDWEKSFIELPDAKHFCEIEVSASFSTATPVRNSYPVRQS
jgi:hypothetical protein